MQIHSTDLVLSGRDRRIGPALASKRGLVALTRGVFVPSTVLGIHQQPWIVRQRVAEARLLAIQSQLRADAAFTAESALGARGLAPWWDNPDVCLRRANFSGRRFPVRPVRLGGVQVPAARVRQFCGAPRVLGKATGYSVGVPLAPDHLVVLDLAAGCHPLQAFHDVSLLIRYEVGFDRRDLTLSSGRADVYKDMTAARLRDFNEAARRSRPPTSSTRAVPGLAKALAILDAADPGVESPAESALLWALKCILPNEVEIETQRPFQTRRGRRNVDIAIPGYRVAIEATGYGKYGGSSASAHQVAQAAVLRQQDLEDLGWIVINVTYDQVKRPIELLGYLGERLGKARIRAGAPRGPLFAPPTPLLFHPSRRF